MYAMMTEQGTAAPETALCGNCVLSGVIAIPIKLRAVEYDKRMAYGGWKRCPDDNTLVCKGCGKRG